MAQLGSFVPAKSCELTPLDRIFTRLGATDRILMNQSTFFVELAETATALRGATHRSLVIMDELGRGTSTFDGTAIASATVKHLVEENRCLSLFATHYHSVLAEWQNESKVRLGHMQCLVHESAMSESSQTTKNSITFLYTLGEGTCPKSFGINVAHLAGLPDEVLSKAKEISSTFEAEQSTAAVSSSDTFHSVETNQSILAAIDGEQWDELLELWNRLQ
jgi:DNA mismatch repair protein MSH6